MVGRCQICQQSAEYEPFVSKVCGCDDKLLPQHFSCIAESIIDFNTTVCHQCRHPIRDYRIEEVPEYMPSLLELLSFPPSLRRALQWAAINLILGFIYNLSTASLSSDTEILGLTRPLMVIFNAITVSAAVFSYVANPSKELRYIRIKRFTNGNAFTTILDTYVWHMNLRPNEQNLADSNQQPMTRKTIRCRFCRESGANERLMRICRCKNVFSHQQCLVANLVMSMDKPCDKCGTYYRNDNIRREPTFWNFITQSSLGAPLLFFRILETISFFMDMDDLWFNPRRSHGFGRKSLPILTIQLVLESLGWVYLWFYAYPQWYSKQPQKTIIYRSENEVHKIVLNMNNAIQN